MSSEFDQQLVELGRSTGRSGFIELRRLLRGLGGDATILQSAVLSRDFWPMKDAICGKRKARNFEGLDF